MQNKQGYCSLMYYYSDKNQTKTAGATETTLVVSLVINGQGGYGSK